MSRRRETWVPAYNVPWFPGLPWYIPAFGELALCKKFRGRIHSYLYGVTQGAMAACHRQLNWSREPCTGPWWRDRIQRVRRVTWRSQEGWAFQVDGRTCVMMQKAWCKRGCCSSRGRTKWLGHEGVAGEGRGGPDERDAGAKEVGPYRLSQNMCGEQDRALLRDWISKREKR